MIYKRILAVVTLILVIIAIVLVNKKAKNQLPKKKQEVEIKSK